MDKAPSDFMVQRKTSARSETVLIFNPAVTYENVVKNVEKLPGVTSAVIEARPRLAYDTNILCLVVYMAKMNNDSLEWIERMAQDSSLILDIKVGIKPPKGQLRVLSVSTYSIAAISKIFQSTRLSLSMAALSSAFDSYSG